MNDLLTDENLDKVERLRAVADGLGTNLAVLSMAWILQHPQISCVIAGASKPSQLENNIKTSGFVIPADAMAEIDKITGFHRFERHVG
ncbi:aldo/keto reductase [Bifidobacterium jacchi]|uniref:Oxidoreductase n=1 Tax=Bifidobacterium jacchi TaxID=2490545 RepID=A0A5N5RNP0_9BIFI|nr:aldo/keto reductase [Bifidobacterium jacchi]KAB5608703.1 oxidoreductase [Bifidobacterium jacchi]